MANTSSDKGVIFPIRPVAISIAQTMQRSGKSVHPWSGTPPHVSIRSSMVCAEYSPVRDNCCQLLTDSGVDIGLARNGCPGRVCCSRIEHCAHGNDIATSAVGLYSSQLSVRNWLTLPTCWLRSLPLRATGWRARTRYCRGGASNSASTVRLRDSCHPMPANELGSSVPYTRRRRRDRFVPLQAPRSVGMVVRALIATVRVLASAFITTHLVHD